MENPTHTSHRSSQTSASQFNLVDKKDMIPLAEFNDTIAGEYK